MPAGTTNTWRRHSRTSAWPCSPRTSSTTRRPISMFRSPCPEGPRDPSRRDADGLHLHVLVQRADPATLPTEAAQLEAAERGVTRTDAVDRDLPGADPAGHADGPIDVGAP